MTADQARRLAAARERRRLELAQIETTVRRSFVAWIKGLVRFVGMAAIGLVLMSAMLGCGGRQAMVERTQKGLEVTLTTINAARDAFLGWDAEHQKEILDGSGSADGFRSSISVYRAKRAKVTAAFAATYDAIAGVAALLPVFDAGTIDLSTLATALVNVADAVAAVRREVAALEGSSP